MDDEKLNRSKISELLDRMIKNKDGKEKRLSRFEKYLDLDKMRSSKWTKYVFAAGILMFLFYVGGALGGGLSYSSDTSFGFFSCIRRAVTTKTGFIGLMMVFIVTAGFVGFLKLRGMMEDEEDPRGFARSKEGNYGTSGELEYKRLKDIMHVTSDAVHEDGIIIGKICHNGIEQVVAVPKDSPYNRNFAICGSQGSMKSWAFARNMIAQCIIRGESMFTMDPKGELYEDTVFWLKMNGYEVIQWNLKDMEYSNSWDILSEIDDGKYIDILCDVIIKNTLEGDHPDHFYDNIEKDLLKALCLYAYTMYPYGKRTLGAAYELLIQNTPEELDALFENLRQTDPENPAIGPYMLFSKAPNSKGSAVLGLGTRLQIFQTAIVRSITGTKDIDITEPAKRKCAVFCIVSDQDSTYNVLATTLISMMFVKLVRYADSRPGRRCDVDVHFILDEFPNCGEVPDFKKKLATVRSRGIGIDVIYQNLPQLQNRYPEQQWEEILGGCDFRILLACNEMTTSDYNSKLTGNMTIEVESKRKNLNTIRMTDFTPQMSSTKSVGQRMWQLEDELRRMEPDKLILFVRGEKPVKLTKFPFNEHPSFGEYKVKKTWTYIPGWRLDANGVDRLTGKTPQKDITGTPVTEEWVAFSKDLITGKLKDKDGKTERWQKYLTEEDKEIFKEEEKQTPAEKTVSGHPADKNSSRNEKQPSGGTASHSDSNQEQDHASEEKDHEATADVEFPAFNTSGGEIDFSDFGNFSDADMAEPFADEAPDMEGQQMEAQQAEEAQKAPAMEEHQETLVTYNEERREVKIEKPILETVIERPGLIGTPRVPREYQPNVQDMAFNAYGLKDDRSAACVEQAAQAPEIQEQESRPQQSQKQASTMGYTAANIKNKNKRVDPGNMSNDELMKLWAKNQQR